MPILRGSMPRNLPPAARVALAIAVLGGLAAVTRLSSWRKPLATDTGQYLYIGDLILEGGTPYEDAVTNKGPMTTLLFAVIRLGAGTSMTAVRITLVVFAIVAALALGAYVAKFAGRNAGILAAVTFAIFAALPGFQGDDPNTEQYGIAFILVGWWLATNPGVWWALGAGAVTSAAVLMNPAFAVTMPFVAFELWRARPDGIGERLKRVGLGLAGGLAFAAPLLLWLYAAGAFDDMWDQSIMWARHSVDQSFSEGGVPEGASQGGGSDASGSTALPAFGLWFVGLGGALLACTDRRLRRVAIPAILWIGVGWARVKAAGYEYPHHYYPVLPGLVIGLVTGIARVWEWIPSGRVALRWGIAVVAIAIPFVQWVAKPERDALDTPRELRWGERYESFALAYPIAEFLRANTDPDETILVVATDPEVYWLADRHAPTRYFDVFPLLRDRKLVGRRRLDVLHDPPAAIVAMPYAEDADPWFPELLDMGLEYPPAYEVDGARVWLLKDS